MCQIGRNLFAELVDVLAIDALRETKSNIDDITVESEEVLGDLTGARVFGVESSDKGGGLAVVVELVMD